MSKFPILESYHKGSSGLGDGAYQWIVNHGFPSSKEDAWKYFDVNEITSKKFVPHLNSGLSNIDLENTTRYYIAFDGHEIFHSNLPQGVEIERIQFEERVYNDAFDAMHDVFSKEKILLHIKKSCAEPISVIFVSKAGSLHCVKMDIKVYRDVECALFTKSIGDGEYFRNISTDIFLAQSAKLKLCNLQSDASGAFYISRTNVFQKKDSEFDSYYFAVGSRAARNEIAVSLEEKGASTNLYGLYITKNTQYHESRLFVNHIAGDCISNELYKGIVDRGGESVFDGLIHVCHGANKTNANMINKNLSLSGEAKINTRPRLEIFADDVKCAHGATTGKLEQDTLFYMRSRGIKDEDIFVILTEAFALEVIEKIKHIDIRNEIIKYALKTT